MSCEGATVGGGFTSNPAPIFSRLVYAEPPAHLLTPNKGDGNLPHPEIPFKVKQMNFADKWDAISWMCRNQLGRRNLTDEQRTYLIGKQYEAQKMAEKFHGNQYSGSLQNGDHQNGRTKDKIARDLGVGSSTVERSEHFAHGLDAAEQASPGIRESVLSGEVKAPKNLISEIRNVPEEHRTEAVEAIKRGDGIKKSAPARVITGAGKELCC